MSSSSSSSLSSDDFPSCIPDGTTVQNVLLVSIDGWGLSKTKEGNAILNASTPNMDKLANQSVYCPIDASGLSVGLPEGVMGNSEVGHLTMGSGRVSFQDLVRINHSISLIEKDPKSPQAFHNNPTLNQAFEKAKTQGRVHFLGLVSDGGVHSHNQHLYRFLEAAKQYGVPKSFVHFFADGRDTPPTSGVTYIDQLQQQLQALQYGQLASITGRYFAMDRDKRWDRIKIAVDALLGQPSEHTTIVPADSNIIEIVKQKYVEDARGDEFLKPLILNSEGIIQPNDVLIFINFRSDRMREIVSSLKALSEGTKPNFDISLPSALNLSIYQMTQYDEKMILPTLYAPQTMVNGLSEWLSKHQYKQYHIAETEKYAHVTFFFAGGIEKPFALEDRKMIQSPSVPTYDQKPEMSQRAVADAIVDTIKNNNTHNYKFIMCNFAAPDMVGHTGVYDAAVQACTVCDEVIGQLYQACQENGWTLVVTADHGNAEEMIDENGKPKTSHTTNLIPVLIASPPGASRPELRDDIVSRLTPFSGKEVGAACGGLSDVAPTVLTLMGLSVPREMTGQSLVKSSKK